MYCICDKKICIIIYTVSDHYTSDPAILTKSLFGSFLAIKST